jgi:N-carbamoyl-L-amino-acid hydrolase
MPSGAAHDAQIMARLTRSGMIFVPSKNGRSHSSAEWTDWEYIEAGANVALHTLLRLAMEDEKI